MGCDYSLVGHSERRKIFRETDVDINHALAFVQQHGVTPILCVGESKEEYELGLNEEICVLQLRKDLKELTPEQVNISSLHHLCVNPTHQLTTICTLVLIPFFYLALYLCICT